MYSAVILHWTESESGWGQRPDGTTIHKDMKTAIQYIADYWEKEKKLNTSGEVPSVYCRPESPEIMEVTQELYHAVQVLESFWLTTTSWWKTGNSYILPTPPEPEEKNMSKTVEELSIEELERILEAKKKELNTAPDPLPEPDFDKLKRIVKEHVDRVADGSYHEDDDDKQYFFEEAIEAVYGKSIWTWYNKTR